MADPNNTYVAWDGEHYEGQPPAGWYLAADNRWWPPQELIESAGGPISDPQLDAYLETPDPVDPYAADPDDPFGPGADYQAPYQAPAPPESWAPQASEELNTPNPPPPAARQRQTPQTSGRPGRGSTTPVGRRRKGRFPIGFAIPLFVFGLLRCSAEAPNAEFPTFDEPTVVFGDEEAFEFAEAGTVVSVNGEQLTVSGTVPFYIEFNTCEPDAIPVFLANDGFDGEFVVDLTFQPLQNSGVAAGRPFQIRRTETLDQGEVVSAVLAVPADLVPLEDCTLIDATVARR